MIIGAIESVRPNRVMGWVHCHAADLRGATILAFVDRRCVGSGRIDVFRQDLADAGLLHGHLGFDFPISLDAAQDTSRVVVSLERCEAVILQRDSAVVPARIAALASDAFAAGPVPSREVAAWLRNQEAISAAELDVIESLTDFGVAIWQPDGEGPDAQHAELPLAAAARLFSACALSEVEAGQVEIASFQALQAVLSEPSSALAKARLLALHAERPVRVRVQEGLHKQSSVEVEKAALSNSATNWLEYPVSPDSLLLLHRNCRFAVDEFNSNCRLRLLFPQTQT